MCLKELLALAALDVTKKEKTVTDLKFLDLLKRSKMVSFNVLK
jgi:hypothetical protein